MNLLQIFVPFAAMGGKMLNLSLLALCFLTAGCTYSAYKIQSPEAPENHYKRKYYVNSIKGYFVDQQQADKIKAELPFQYPEFFVEEPEQGTPVDFYWSADYQHNGLDTAVLSGLTFGILPCVTWHTHTGKITARIAPKNDTFFSHRNYPNRTLTYIVKETSLLHVFPILSHLVDFFWMPIIRSGKDTNSSFNAGTHEKLSSLHNYCDANMRLFPRACNMMAADMQLSPAGERIPSYLKRKTAAPAAPAKKEQEDFSVPAPEELVVVEARPKKMLFGEWESRQFSKTRVLINNLHRQITSSNHIQKYVFMENGKLKIDLDVNGNRSSMIGQYSYNGSSVTIQQKDARGMVCIMQYKVLWYSDNQMELRVLNDKSMERLLNAGGNIKEVSYSTDDKGISTTSMILDTGKSDVNSKVTILTTPMIFNKRQPQD